MKTKLKEFKQGKTTLTINHNKIHLFGKHSFKLNKLNDLQEAKEYLEELNNGTNWKHKKLIHKPR